MARYLLRRLAGYLVLVILATSLVYLLAASTLEPRANFEGRNPPPPEQVVDARLTELNLNDKTPILQRYATWVSGVAVGDFGMTWEGQSVNAEMWRRIGVSLRLLLAGTVLGGLLGVLIGAFAATRQYRPSDRATTVLSFVVLSMPVFVLAVLLQAGGQWANGVAGVKIFEYIGEYTPGLPGGFVARLTDRMRHLVLPTLTIVLTQAAIYSRYQRSMMLDVLDSDFVRTAMAKGLRRRQALLRHALRMSLVPATTYFAYALGLLLTGAVFTEKIFVWHGMGEWLVDSIFRHDVNAVAAIGCCTAILMLIAGLISDIGYALLDPRVRVG